MLLFPTVLLFDFVYFIAIFRAHTHTAIIEAITILQPVQQSNEKKV